MSDLIYNNDTKIKELTVGQLKDIITECILSTRQISNMLPSTGAIPLSQLLGTKIDENTPRC